MQSEIETQDETELTTNVEPDAVSNDIPDDNEADEGTEDAQFVTDEYVLQHGSIKLYVERPDLDNVATLSHADLLTFVEHGIAQWSYRAGSRKANNGKTFSLTDVAKAMRTKLAKTGAPSKDDKAMALAYMTKSRSTVNKDETMDNAGKLVAQTTAFNVFIQKMCTTYGFTVNGEWKYEKHVVEHFFRHLRLAKQRQAKKADF